MTCSAYALLLVVVMIAMIVVRLTGLNRGAAFAGIVVPLLACGAPFCFVANKHGVPSGGPVAAGKARRRMRPSLWISVFFAVAAWGSAAAILVAFMRTQMI